MPRVAQRYAFDNTSPQASDHHDALSKLFDEFTRTRLTSLLDLDGAACLEVGAGAGGIAVWLAEKVGVHGYVTATDIAPQHIPTHPRLRVIAHDITADPLPDDGYRLIHARLLLNHLTDRRRVLKRLATALAPGGVLVTEDFDPMPADEIVAVAPTRAAAVLVGRFVVAQRHVLAAHGGDSTWSLHALAAMREEGLGDVHNLVHARSWAGGGPGARLLAAGIPQLRQELIAAGLTGADLDGVRGLLADPRLVLHGHRLVSTSGRAYPADNPADHST